MIPEPGALALFALAAFALVVVPGPAVLYIVAQSLDGGRRAGFVSMLGIQTGALVHVAAAAIGLSSLLLSSSTAFQVVKFAGAAYLVVLGLRRLLVAGEPLRTDEVVRMPRSARRLFAQGVVVNVLNPKTALFFFAFLPQFVDAGAAHPAAQMVVLGLLFVAIAAVGDGTYALAAGAASGLLRRSRGVVRAQRYVAGSVFIGLGVATALGGSRRGS